jgi:Phosphoesterase family
MAAFQSGGVTPVKAFNPNRAPGIQQRLLSQFADNATGFHAASPQGSTPVLSNVTPAQAGGPQCGLSLGSNVQVNQGCLNISARNLQGRGQAQNETTIAVNPNNPGQLLAASNDYTLGDGLAGGTSYSSDGGQTWQDSQVPLEFTRGSDFAGDPKARMYWQGGGDPSVAWDSRGDAFFAGLHFNRGIVPTIMDRLDSASLPWRLYTSGVSTAGGAGSGGQYSWSVCPTFAECLDTGQRSDMVPVSNFVTDAKNGTLPSFSIVLPQGTGTGPTSQHNGTSMAVGDNWIGQVASALEQGPEWGSTALFITYDDCGCFYDQVAPGINADGTPQGIRTPLVIVSPYAKAGYTDSNQASFASILAFTEQTFGLPALSLNDAGAYAFSNSFDYSQAPLAAIPMVQQPVVSTGVVVQDPNDPT